MKFLQSKSFHETKLLLKLAGPIIVGQVGQNLIQLADTIMVGSIGPVALGASAFAGSIFIVFLIFGLGILAPTTALFAKMQGQENFPLGGVLLRHSLMVAMGISALLMAVIYLLIPHLNIFGQRPEILSLGVSFFKIIAWSIIPSMIYQCYKQFTDGIGKTKVGMFVMIAGVIINVALNYVLIHGLYGFPKLGLNGSGWATLIARTLMAFAMILYVHLHPNFSKYMTEHWIHRFDHQMVKNMLRLGIPTGFTYFFEVGAFSSAAVMMGWFGAIPLAAHQITISLASTSFLITLGIGIAASIRVGFEMGRGDYPLARHAGFTAIQVGGIYMGLCALGFFFLRHWFPTLYVSDPDVIQWAARFFVVVAIFEIFDGVQAVSIGALRGMSDTQWPGIIAFFAYWVMGLPGGYLLAFHLGVGPVGIWVGLLIGLIFASILLTWRFHLLSRRYTESSVSN
ncbi:MATE family efflux transporter [Bdellovibrio svalbardensis]|uniref:Multidrug-efflux transporter n=1 Tax=Bdellovibrio svalbardensis TaxID=2972972 RepID=A0ABT6DH81_9BACT|nr:MATE family efflux transporter [Bdellovibrio svalbardensis]MDG0816205.1 MATE family efflux transporter [Bdellovibrio svalbardensis]